MGKTDIIIVEDDPLVGVIAREILEEHGYAVQLEQDSRAALADIKTSMPRLVITDIMMPGITGMHICWAVKSDPALKDVKVMIMSAKSFETERRRAAMLGAGHFLVKPFTPEGLVAAVQGLIGDPENKNEPSA